MKMTGSVKHLTCSAGVDTHDGASPTCFEAFER